MADDSQNSRKTFRHRRVITYVKSPLGFFTLALLIIETFLVGAGALFNLSETMRIVAMAVGVGLFIGVVATVTTLVVKYPQALVFSEGSHLEWESMQVFGDKARPLLGRPIDVGSGTEPPQKPVGQLNQGGK